MTQQRPSRLIVFTGAGLSADSGVPTFRDSNGLWENHSVDDVANGLTWSKNWDMVRRFYNARRSSLATVEPNAAHIMITDWQRRFDTVVLTQNIDDLLERAGCADVVHLHGELTMMRCTACGNEWNVGYTEVGTDSRCAKCNSLKGTRPKVVFFHERAPNYARMHAAFKNLRAQDCVVVIGTSGQVINMTAFLFDAPCLRVLNNLEPSQHMDESIYDHVLFGRASLVCAEVDRVVSAHMMNAQSNPEKSTD